MARVGADDVGRWLIFASVPTTAWYGLGMWRLVAPPPSWVAWLGFGALVGGITLVKWSPRAIRRTLPAAYAENKPVGMVGPKESFEWHPANEPTPVHGGIGIRHHWWEPSAKLTLQVSFETSDAPEPLVARAVKDGTTAARRALPGRGKVRARVLERDAPGPTSRVRVRLEVAGAGADGEWTRAALAAFEGAFVARYRDAGLRAARL